MKEQYLTISVFALRAGVSQQAIGKQTRNPNSRLFPYIKKENGRTLINSKALFDLYKIDLYSNETCDNPEETTNKTESNPTTTQEQPIETQDTTPIQPNENNPKQPIQPPVNPYENQLIEALQAQISHLLEEIEAYKIRENKWEETEQEYKNKIDNLTDSLIEIAGKNADTLHGKEYAENYEKIQRIEQAQASNSVEVAVIDDKKPEAEVAIASQKSFIRKFIDLFK